MSKHRPGFKNKKITKSTKILLKYSSKLTKKSASGRSQIAARRRKNKAILRIWTCFRASNKKFRSTKTWIIC